MNNITGKQWLQISGVFLSVVVASTANLTDLFGSGNAKLIVSAASLLNAFIQGVSVVLMSQGNIVKEVSLMPGVDPLKINAQANPTVAGLALDPAQAKIAPAAGAGDALRATVAKEG